MAFRIETSLFDILTGLEKILMRALIQINFVLHVGDIIVSLYMYTTTLHFVCKESDSGYYKDQIARAKRLQYLKVKKPDIDRVKTSFAQFRFRSCFSRAFVLISTRCTLIT